MASSNDYLNQARAMRLAELLDDYRTLLLRISSLPKEAPGPNDGLGSHILARILYDAEALLSTPFRPPADAEDDNDHDNGGTHGVHLKRIMLDASVRRFRAGRLCQRAQAALRYIYARTALVHSGRPHPAMALELQRLDAALRQDLLAVTDARVYYDLQSSDSAQGRWLEEDPSLEDITRAMRLVS